MIYGDQCPAHTHTPWGTSTHSYGHRLRQIFMGALLALCLTVFALAIYFTCRGQDGSDRSVDENDGHYLSIPRAPRHLDVFQPMSLLIPSLGACGKQLGSCKASANEVSPFLSTHNPLLPAESIH
jgi:hypothetical protein